MTSTQQLKRHVTGVQDAREMSKINDPVVTKAVLDSALKSTVEEIAGIIDVFASRMDARFNILESRMDKVEASLDRLAGTVDGLIKRIDRYETGQVARDAEVQRMKRWIQQIAKETGVKLKGLT